MMTVIPEPIRDQTPPTRADLPRRKIGIDWLLIMGVALSPVTAIGLGPLNIGEWLVLIWCVINVLKFRQGTVVSRFDLMWWLLFFCALLLGSIVGIQVTPEQTSTAQLFTWGYFCIIFISITTGLADRASTDVERILNRIGVASLLLHTGLLIYSYLVSPQLFGIDLWYQNVRFAGGGDNPHYVSLVILVSLFIVFRMLLRNPRISCKLFFLLLLGGGIWVAQSTGSTTILTSALGTVFTLIIIYILRSQRVGLLWFVFGSAVIIGIFRIQSLIEVAQRIIQGDENGEGRIAIWLSYFEAFEPLHLLGLGPGTHAMGGKIEYHNLYLEVVAMAGLLGLLLLFVIFGYAFRGAISVDLLLAAPLLSLMFYGFGGFSGRRLIFWVIFAVIIVLFRKKESKISPLSDHSNHKYLTHCRAVPLTGGK